ncbi:MAG TPA: hypothetical protein PK079_01615 [Leptospiraceae bacterium]|nr:hypothetical protein [Leptospiraceae bacterium]HMW04788.1 hypothetical protein [Leptospiraceae bacterium]HMX32805.1 hypothetical protein [Leptospiraceae bacterium]HMY33544.1 hypothetical protein [Leptospiraceae bacterium]HMZ67566.1 hypothetical protein [Leptospiraceae bacterium]
MIKEFFISFFFISFISLYAVEPPNEPTPPTVDLADKTSPVKKDSKKDKPKKTQAVTVKLCDGRQVSGNIEYEKEEIFFQHLKEGIKYDKKMQITEIKQIKILSWDGKKGKKVKDGITYQFNPSKVQITSLSSESFIIKGLADTEFQNLNISNQNGIAKLFSFWVDLQYESGNWYSKLPAINGTEREDCHSDVIRIIQFN